MYEAPSIIETFAIFANKKLSKGETFSFSNTTELEKSSIRSWSVNAAMTTKICRHKPLFYDDMSINMVNDIRVNMHVKRAANCGHHVTIMLDHKLLLQQDRHKHTNKMRH
jgi:hypothetical protein